MQKNTIETQVEEAAEQAGGLLRSKYGLWAIAGISFVESALVVPILTDPFLVAYILADKRSVYKGIIITTIASVLGGVFAYILALSFYEFIAEQYLVGAVGEQLYSIIDQFQKGTFMITLLGALTPIPYTLVALGAGFVKGSLLMFILASTLGRGVRYSIVGWVTYKFGEQALSIARKRILQFTVAFVLLAVVYFGFLK